MAITRVARGTFQFDLTASNTPGTASVNAGTGADRAMVAFVYWRRSQNSSFAATGGCTYNGVNATQLFAPINNGGQYNLQAWVLDEPATGTNTLSFNPSGGTGTQTGCLAGYAFFDGVDLTATMADLANYLSTAFSDSLAANSTVDRTVTSATGDHILFMSAFRDGAAASGRTATPGAVVGTLEQLAFANVYAMAQGDGAAASPSSTPSMTWDNNAGTIERRFALTLVEATAAGPAITTQPASQTVLLSETTSATFTVAATGVGTLTYQWNRNASPISGATSASYTATGLVIGDDGDTFTCDVTDDNGTTTSATATLTVLNGDALNVTSGTTNGSGVATFQFTSDASVSAQAGTFARVQATAGGVTKTICMRPGA